MNEINDHRLKEVLERLFVNKIFQEEIKKSRSRLNIPENGFDSNNEFEKWIDDDFSKFIKIQEERNNITIKFKKPINISLWVEAYLVLGKNYKDYNEKLFKNKFNSYYRGFGGSTGRACDLEKKPDWQRIDLQIYPGASQNDIKKYLSEHWDEIKEYLGQFDRKVKNVRKRKNKERDSKIYKLHKKGLIKSDGKMPIDEKSRNKIPKKIRKIDMDRRRTIIEEQKKLREKN